jgi:hypothetical protein
VCTFEWVYHNALSTWMDCVCGCTVQPSFPAKCVPMSLLERRRGVRLSARGGVQPCYRGVSAHCLQRRRRSRDGVWLRYEDGVWLCDGGGGSPYCRETACGCDMETALRCCVPFHSGPNLPCNVGWLDDSAAWMRCSGRVAE